MKRAKKILALIVSVISVILCFGAVGCNDISDEKKKVVCTIFPEYDWVREIIKGIDGYQTTLLLDNGVDLHSYQPTVEDIATIGNADLFIYVGGESDKWVDRALSNAINKNIKAINLLEILGNRVKEEEQVEGMQGEEGEEIEEEQEYDEHVWLSLKNAKIISKNIAEELKKIDSENEERIEQNINEYIEKLDDLDREYQEAVENKTYDTLLFGDRFPFRYIVEDYGLNYYGAFKGCSAETEASFETIIFLARKVDELNLPTIMVLEGENQKIANQIKNTTAKKNQEIITVNSLQSITKNDMDRTNYLEIMRANLISLKKALGTK